MNVFQKLKYGMLIFSGTVFLSGTALAESYRMPAAGDDIIGEVIQVRAGGQSLTEIGERYGIGMHEMLEANRHLGVTQATADNRLRSSQMVTVPTQFILPPYRKGIVVNLPEARLYYFAPNGQYVYTYPLGLGRTAWRTPLAHSSIIEKKVNPTWTVPKSIKKFVYEETGRMLPNKVPPGPDNPLGPYAMRLSMGNYLIHGTNQPWTIGKYVSSGCIRMYNDDVEELFQMVSVGTPVKIINHAQKAGWSGGQLYLESQEEMDLQAAVSSLNPGSVKSVVMKAVKENAAAVDWGKVNRVVNQSNGLPHPVSNSSASSRSYDPDQSWNF